MGQQCFLRLSHLVQEAASLRLGLMTRYPSRQEEGGQEQEPEQFDEFSFF